MKIKMVSAHFFCRTMKNRFSTGAHSDHVISVLTHKKGEGVLHHVLEDCQQ